MKENRNVLCKRIRSAKSWLNRAEDNFGKKNDVQGELNLLLAQAELKHLQEKQTLFLPKKRNLLAFLTAVLISLSFLAVWQLQQPSVVVEKKFAAPIVQSGAVEKNELTEANKNKVLVVDLTKDVRSVPATSVPVASKKSVEAVATKKQTTFTENEMRELVRTAGQVLHGNS